MSIVLFPAIILLHMHPISSKESDFSKEISPKRAIQEGYVKVIQDMYGGTKTRVKTRCGRTEYFEVKVGLHQGSALSPLLFIIIMDVLAEEARTKPPWAMLFADDLIGARE